MRRFLPLVLLLLAIPHLAPAKQPLMIRLLAEADPKEGDTFTTQVALVNPPKTIAVHKVPIVTEKDIVSFYPFTAPGGGIGAYFKLDNDGSERLESHTTEYRGTLVVAVVNGRVASAMMVDKKILDGIMLIPTGIHPIELAQLQTEYPVMGREKNFKDQKKQAEILLKAAEKAQPKPTPKPKNPS